MQRDPRQRRVDNHSDSGSGIGYDQRGEYGSRERRPSPDRYPSRSERGHLNRSPRRSASRSRSRSPSYRGRGGNDRDPRDPRIEPSRNTRDDWTKTTDAFLKNLGAPPNNDQGSFDGRSHGGYPGPNGGYAGHGANSQRPYFPDQQTRGIGGPPRNQSDQQTSYHERKRYDGTRSPSANEMNARDMASGASNYRDGMQDSERGQQKMNKSGNGSGDESSDSSSSNKERGRKKQKNNEEIRKEPIQGITVEQREKLMNQKKQYIDAKLKLEDQLLKLKEEREELKERGNKHEDKIMRDNAKLQKEVKTRVQYVVEVLGKIEAGLKMPVIRSDKQRSTSRSPGKEERRVRRMSPGDEERKEKRNKRKDPSSSDDASDGEQKEDRKRQKKKKKRSKKSKMSSSDLSDSESAKEGNNPKANVVANATNKGFIQVDENIFRTMATMNGLNPDGSNGGAKKSGSSDDMVMGLLSKMSEAYMNSKKENGELALKVADLELRNDELEKKVGKQQKKIEKLKRKLQKVKHHGKDSDDMSDKDVEKGSRNDAGVFEDKNGSKRKSHHGDHIPDILLGDVMKIKRDDTMSPPTSRSSSRVAQNVDTFKAPIEEKREISIRGTSPLRHPERITTKDTEIVRSVRSRMMEKEAERKHGNSEERGFSSEYGTERDKSIDGRPQGSERRYEKDDRYPGRQPEQEEERRPGMDNRRSDRETSKDPERGRERSRSKEWDRGRKNSDSRSRGRSHSRDRRTRSKSRGRSGSRERRRRSRSRSSEYRYGRRYDDRRDDRGRYGYDNRRDGRQREQDRLERRERERERERERDRSRDRDKGRDRRDRNDRIDIDEWTTKPSDEKNPGLSSIKEKLRQKQEEEEAENRRKQKEMEENEKKQKWANISTFEEPQKLDPPKSQEMTRPQVAIQWGQRDKVTPDPHNAGMQMSSMKKAIPMVGKMPWLNRSNKSEERGMSAEKDALPDTNASKRASRFGAQVSIAPPTVLSNVPAPAVMAPVPPPQLSRIQASLNEINQRNQMGAGSITGSGSVGSVTFDHVHGNSTGSSVVQPSFRKKNTMPTELDISSMLEAAKQHINRAKESKKDVASILCPTSPPPPQREENERAQEEDSNDRTYQRDSMSAEIEIPLPPLPAAQDKDPDAMLDTRTRYKTPDKDMEAEKFKEAMTEKNLPPGWDKKAAETVQNAPSQQSASSMMATGGMPPGTQANNFFGPPGTSYYGGAMSQMRGDPYSGQPQPQQPVKESKPKPDVEGDASELAMLGIDPSDFDAFGN